MLTITRLCRLFCWSAEGLTDRWGCYREIDATDTYLIAKFCNANDTTEFVRDDGVTYKGCVLQYSFHKCGCACAYAHARRRQLGTELMKMARKNASRSGVVRMGSWNFSVHTKSGGTGGATAVDIPGVLSECQSPTDLSRCLNDLPVVGGHARNPRECVGYTGTRLFAESVSDAVPKNVQVLADELNKQIYEAWTQMPC